MLRSMSAWFIGLAALGVCLASHASELPESRSSGEAPSDRAGPTLTVFDSRGVPCEFATVEFFLGPTDRTLDLRRSGAFSIDTREPVARRLTDGDGELQLPELPEGRHRARARVGEEFGQVDFYVGPSRGSGEITARPRSIVTTRITEVTGVVTRGGVPVEGQVVVLMQDELAEGPSSASYETNSRSYTWALTNSSGRVTFGIDRYSNTTLARATRIALFAVRFGEEPVRVTTFTRESAVEVDLELPPGVTLDLQLPSDAPGPADVAWARGKEYPVGAASHIYWLEDATLQNTLGRFTRTWVLPIRSSRKVSGFAPNETYTFWVRAEGFEPQPMTVTLTSEPQQDVQLSLGSPKAGPLHATLQLRVVDEEQQALTENELRELTFEIHREGEEPYSFDLGDPSRGAPFECAVPYGVDGELLVFAEERAPRKRILDEPVARLPMPPIAASETREFEVQVPRAPSLIAGRVVADGGARGVPATRLTAKVSEELRLLGKTDTHGRFEIRSYRFLRTKVDGLRGTLSVEDPWCAVPIEFTAGQRDLELEAQRTGTLRGRIRGVTPDLQSRIDVDLVRIRPTDVPWTLSYRNENSVFLRGGGCFESRHMPPGEYTLVAKVAGLEVLRVPELQIEPGEILAPLELTDAVVGGDLRWVEVKVVDTNDEPVAGAKVVPFPDLSFGQHRSWDDERDRGVTTDADGIARVLIRDDEDAGVDVQPPWRGRKGLRRAWRRLPTFPVTVTLPPR